jgi:hypothetical protein
MNQEKGCTICGIVKPIADFYSRYDRCKECVSDEAKDIRKRNPIQTALINPLPGEEWMPVKGYEFLYRVSSLSRVTSLCKSVNGIPRPRRREKLLKPYLNKVTGYWCHVLSSFGTGKDKMRPVHILVATHFIPNPDNLPEVNHKYGDKSDNRAISLEWSSRSDNIRHAFRTGLIKPLKGAQHPKAKLTEAQVLEIFKAKDGPRKLSRDLKLPYSTVMGIKNGSNWNSVTGLPPKNKRKSFQ